MNLRRTVRRARKNARIALLGMDVLRHTEVLPTLSVKGTVAFARSIRDRRPGTQVLVHWYACHTPESPALLFEDTRLTYAQLDARINRLARGFAALGVGPGDRVAVMMENCHQYVEVQQALFHLAGTTVQIGYRLKAAEVQYILANSAAKVILHGAEQADVVRDALVGLASGSPLIPVALGGTPIAGVPRAIEYEAMLSAQDGTSPPTVSGRGTGGLMMYTSGTTGRPKGAYRDAGSTGVEPSLSFLRQIPIRSDERHLCACPLYHGAGPTFILFTFAVGGTVVLMKQFDAEEVLATIEREAITSAMLVPTMYNRILALPAEVLRRYDLSSLRWLVSGAAPLPTELARRIEDFFGPILYNFYGATETGFVTLALPGEHTARPGTIGRALGGVDIRLLDEGGKDVPPGGVGDLYVRSPMLVRGYHADEKATSAAQRDGYFSVGDLGRRDADGYYYLVDRKHDLVISGGVNIYPLEIEERLLTHPAVADVAVVGEPNQDWGESLCAFVVQRPGTRATPDELRAHVTAALADYKRPRKVVFVAALPRNPTGKVLKRELRGWAEGANDGDALAAVPAAKGACTSATT